MKKRRVVNTIALVTFPVSKSGLIPLRHLVEVLTVMSKKLLLITGNEGYKYYRNDPSLELYGIIHKPGNVIIVKVIKYIASQLYLAFNVLRTSRKTDLFLFFIGGPSLILCMFMAKIMRKKVVLALAGSDYNSIKSQNRLLSFPIYVICKTSYYLSNGIIVYGHSLIKEYDLQKYASKIYIAHEHYINFDKYKILKALGERDTLVGYIGRLSEEKGLLRLIEALPTVFKRDKAINALLVGNGALWSKAEHALAELDYSDRFEMIGWVDHDKLPNYINKLKLLVIPSYTEGLPNIMLEAMACGTPVLSTAVGAIPDYLVDEETGFIMEDNTPECISDNIVRAINHPNLAQIAANAHSLAQREFTFKKAATGYKKIIEDLR